METASVTTFSSIPNYNDTMGFSQDELITEVSSPKVSSTVSRLVWTVSMIITIIGVLTNTSVVIIILGTKTLRKKYTNIFLVNQSVIDLVTCLVALLYYVLPAFQYDDSLMSNFLCKFWSSQVLLWGTTSASTFNLLALTLERLADLRDPLNHKIKYTRHHLHATMAVPWILGIGYQAAYCIPTSFVMSGHCFLFEAWKSATWQQTATFISIAIDYIIPAIILVISYTAIVCVLNKQLHTDVGTRSMSREGHYKQSMRSTTKMLLIVSACFFIFWTPSRVLFFLYSINLDLNIPNDVYQFGTIWSMINAICNPFIYVFQYKSFRRATLKTVCCCITSNKPEERSNSTIDYSVTNEA